MRLPNNAHEAHAWRIEEIAPDFRLEDVWELPVLGDLDEFPTLLEVMASLDPSKGASRMTRALFRIRWRVGELLGWDAPANALTIPGESRTTLSDRLPADLRGTATGMSAVETRFTSLYRTDVEWAAEISNRTVHAVMHLGWVEEDVGRYRGQMAVYVKPRGTLGVAYMAAIAPFRHHIVYPALMRQIERAWQTRGLRASPPSRAGAGAR
jgi:Protein of unknown function (DUF2867)